MFCSGQPGSGKSFTLFGPPESIYSTSLTFDSGIVPRAIHETFLLIDMEKKKGRSLKVRMQFREFYAPGKETVGSKTSYSNHTPSKGKMTVSLDELVESCQDALTNLAIQLKKRKVGFTDKNSVSSRSHAVISLCILEGMEEIGRGMLSMIDLAGNEKMHG